MKKSIRLVLGTFLLSAFSLVSCNNGLLPNPNEQGAPGNERLVTNVTLSEEYHELDVDESFTLTPTISYKDDKVVSVTTRWLSSNSRVATVNDNGLVTALKSGTAYISYLAGLKKATCEVKVLGDEPVTPVGPDDPTPGPSDFTISLNYNEASLLPTEELTLTATTSIEAAVSWTVDDASVVSLSATTGNTITVTAESEGGATVTATANGVKARCVINVTDEDYTKNISVYFFIDYNNVDINDPTAIEDPITHEKSGGTKLLAQFKWYGDRPISESGKVPSDITDARRMDPAFPYFIGWSSHTIIDTKNDLWDMEHDLIGSSLSFIYFYGIWSDVAQGGFTK